MGFTLNTAPLAEALRLKLTITTKSLPEVVNHAGKNLALRAVQYTRATPQSQITAELTRLVGHRIGLTTSAGKYRRCNRRRPITKPSWLARNIIAARLWKKGVSHLSLAGGEFDAMVDKLINARRASASYLKAGWLPAAKLFGASPAGATQFGADHGSGKLATFDDLFAVLQNDVPDLWKPGTIAYEEAEEALQYASDFVTEDILVYTDRKLSDAGFVR